MFRRIIAGLFIAGLFIATLLAACGGAAPAAEIAPQPTATPACKDIALDYDDVMKPILAKWNDALKISASTSRIALSAQISTLQEIKREAEAVPAGACVESTHALMVQSMNAAVDGYLAFSAQKTEVEVQRFLIGGQLDYDQALAQINDLSRGVAIAEPTPVPTVAEVVARYEAAGYPIKQRPLNTGGNSWGGIHKGTQVEIVSHADGVLKSVAVFHGGGGKIDAATLASGIQIGVPAWTGAEAWISTRMDTKPDKTLVIGRTIATLVDLSGSKMLTVVFY